MKNHPMSLETVAVTSMLFRVDNQEMSIRELRLSLCKADPRSFAVDSINVLNLKVQQ